MEYSTQTHVEELAGVPYKYKPKNSFDQINKNNTTKPCRQRNELIPT